jgi:hypothetical protein
VKSEPRLEHKNMTARLEAEWVQAGVSPTAPLNLCLTKIYADGTKAEVLLTEAETTILSQLITTRKE